jgi:hypothetical protein
LNYYANYNLCVDTTSNHLLINGLIGEKVVHDDTEVRYFNSLTRHMNQ